MEFHPRINVSNFPLQESKIVLGSFPTWSLARSDKGDENERLHAREINGDFDFFYGSSKNRFWAWYKKYLDNSIIINDRTSIISSLTKNCIGITDAIVSCSRKNKSSLDKHLSNRKYNHIFFRRPLKGESIKILCTSKGVMNEMLLTKLFFSQNADLKLNSKDSVQIQREFLVEVGGDNKIVNNPFYRVIDVDAGGRIECLCLPSPGSPYRRLIDFGKRNDAVDLDYLENYLLRAFNWFGSKR